MTRGFRRSLGISLIELMVAGALFGLFTSMVAGALVLAQNTQDKAVSKLDAVRHASLAEDILTRDIEAARFSSKVQINSAPVPTTAVRPTASEPLMITRLRHNPTYPTYPTITEDVIAVYWFEPNPAEPTTVTPTSSRPTLPGLIRRTLLDDAMNPVAGETAAGRVLVRDAMDFQVTTEDSGGVWLTEVDMWVSTVGNPVSTVVASEAPPGYN